MDSVTHIVIGASLGELFLGKKLGNRALAWGALFGSLPDIDGLFSIFLSPTANLWWHRGPTHSLLVIVILSYLLSFHFGKRWKKQKVSRALAGWFIFTALFSHILLDAFTIYGTSIGWPFPVKRVAWNNFFIIDPFFTLPPSIFLLRCLFLRTKKELPRRRKINAYGLSISAAYILLSFGMKSIAASGFEKDLARRQITYSRKIEAPTPFNILFWRAVIDRENELWVGYRSMFESSQTPIRWTVYPKSQESISPQILASKEFKTLDWFSDHWWIARPHVKGIWIGDMRFGETRIWGERKGMVDSRPAFSWDIEPENPRKKLRQLPIAQPNLLETLSRMAQRICGNRDAWEGNPRLTGITGNLPECLLIREQSPTQTN